MISTIVRKELKICKICPKKMNNKVKCHGCGALVDVKAGKPHDYIGATQGCWDLYCLILEKQYGEYNYPQLSHRLTVDTYAIQHPGHTTSRAIQSVSVHLVSLFCIFERGLDPRTATQKMEKILAKGTKFEWLEPPIQNGQKTVIDVLATTNLAEHENKVLEWAKDVWNCWFLKHGQTVENLYNDNL